MTEIINKGPVDTYTAKGISKQIFKRFITLPTNKQIDATNCNTLTFFIQSPPCVYYSIKVKTNQCGALYIINSAGIAYHQNFSFAYHQADINAHFV